MMKKSLFHSLIILFSLFGISPFAFSQPKPITIYWGGYTADQAMSNVAKDIIQSRYHIPVKLKLVSVGASFLGVAHDKRSLFLAVWLRRHTRST